jgi:hypothetical protein
MSRTSEATRTSTRTTLQHLWSSVAAITASAVVVFSIASCGDIVDVDSNGTDDDAGELCRWDQARWDHCVLGQ